MTETGAAAQRDWASAIKPYLEKESLAAFFLGVSSGFPYALIGAVSLPVQQWLLGGYQEERATLVAATARVYRSVIASLA